MVTVTVETVAAAAERLLTDGKNPTQSAVRTILGGGSYSTIGPLLQQWREDKEEAADLAEIDLPDTLANAGSEMLSRVWRVAMSEALAGHDVLRKQLIQAQAETEAAQFETTEVAASLEADLAARDERIMAFEVKLSTQAEELKATNDRAIIAERDLAGARERADAEAARALRSEKHAEERSLAAKKLDSEVSSLRERLDATNAAMAEQKAEAVRIISERDHAQKDLAASESRLEGV